MPEVAIRATGMVKWFGEGEARTPALRDVSLEAYFGEMLYIVGPSGSGKTTLAERALRHSQAGFRQRLGGRSGHLESWQR